MLGNQSSLGERGRQFCAFSHVAKVAEQEKGESDAGDRAVDSGKDRLRHAEKVAEFLLEIAGLAAVGANDGVRRLARGQSAQSRDIGAGTEATPGAGEQ